MQTGIKKIAPLQKATSTMGGICRWWYIPVNLVALFPKIDYKTQCYETEPQLKAGEHWFGPIPVPDAKLGFEESQEGAKPGPWFKQKLSGQLPGDSPGNRIIRQNMIYYEYIVVAKLRASEQYLLCGTPDSALSFDHGFKSGTGGNSSAGSDFTLSGESPFNAPNLVSFSADIIPMLETTTTVHYGKMPFNRVPTTAEIEAAPSATFGYGQDTAADFRGDLTSNYRFYAERVNQPRKQSFYVNFLSKGQIGYGREDGRIWYLAGTVAATVGEPYNVYCTLQESGFENTLIKFLI